MSVYLDASVIVPLLILEGPSDAVIAFMRGVAAPLVSDFAAAEVASAISRAIRDGRLSVETANARLEEFDLWRGRSVVWVMLEPDDVADATALVRRFELMLRTPDALHLAMARRAAATLATLDTRMINAAQALGLPLAAVP